MDEYRRTPLVSVVVPAHNEELLLKRCLDSIKESAYEFGQPVEVIVVCNRCTDQTKAIAELNGAVVVENDGDSIAQVRNAGIAAASGKLVVTIDADNRMTGTTIREVYDMMSSGKYIGGGAPIRFERYSFPLRCNDIMCRVLFKITGLYCGMFWAATETFKEIGGFVDKKAMEDVATARKLKKSGKAGHKRYTTLKQNYLINSTRKFDRYGDWMYFKLMPKYAKAVILAAFGKPEKFDAIVDELFYSYNN